MKRGKRIPSLHWVELDVFPFSFAVVLTDKAWDEEQQRLRMPMRERSDFMPRRAIACVTTLENTGSGACVSYLKVRPAELAKLSDDAALQVLVHECVHVKQAFMERIREERPGREMEAYVQDHIFREVIRLVMPKVRRSRAAHG